MIQGHILKVLTESLLYSLYPKLSKSPQDPSSIQRNQWVITYIALSHISPRAYPHRSPVDVTSQLVWNLPISLLGYYKSFTPGTLAFFKPLFNVPLSMQQSIFLLNSNIMSLLSKLFVTPCDFWNMNQCLIMPWSSPGFLPSPHLVHSPLTTGTECWPSMNIPCPPHIITGFSSMLFPLPNMLFLVLHMHI